MRRPFLVLLVGAVVFVVGVVQLAFGAVFLANRHDLAFQLEAGLTSGTLGALGLWLVALGALSVGLARALVRGRRRARAAAAVVEVVQLVAGVYTVVTVGGDRRLVGLWTALAAVFVLVVLLATSQARAASAR